MTSLRSLFVAIGAIGIIAAGLAFLLPMATHEVSNNHTLPASAVYPVAGTTTPTVASSSKSQQIPGISKKKVAVTHLAPPPTTVAQSSAVSDKEVRRIAHPYSFAALSFDGINAQTRSALVNIFCTTRSSGARSISGSGVIIDPRGIILTNAHVAQYILLSESPDVDLTCTIRSGAPAQAHWLASVLYIPPVWVEEHATDLHVEHPTGTGEHDYALLHITQSLDGSPPPVFPALSVDVRAGIAFVDDPVLVAGYPAEFIGGITTQLDLFPVSSVTKIKDLFTLATDTIDLLSLGSVIEAQGGSSGGAVTNAWNYLVGIITTTSEGTTTAERDLHALTTSYIDRDMKAESGMNLQEILNGNIDAEAASFGQNQAPALIAALIAQLPKH